MWQAWTRFRNVRVPASCSTDVWMAMDNGEALVGDFCTNADNGIHGYLRSKPDDFQTIDFPAGGAHRAALFDGLTSGATLSGSMRIL
jgi:hypothetical protein